MAALHGKSGTITIGNGPPMEFKNIECKVEDLKWDEEFREDLFRSCGIPSEMMVSVPCRLELTSAGMARLEQERQRLMDQVYSYIDTMFRNHIRYLIRLDDVIEEMEARRWAADYTKTFFRNRPGMRLADALHLERN